MTDDVKQTWAAKIAALLRKAENTDSPEEAETFFAKAQELMAKYAIDEALLRAAGQDKTTDPIVKEEFVTVGIYRHALYLIDYYTAEINGCKAIEITGSPWKTIDGKVFKQTRVIQVVGYKSDIDRVRLLATSLKLQCMRAESVWWREHAKLYEAEKPGVQHRARRGFMFAFQQAAAQKMREAVARGKQSAEAEHGGNSVALVLRDKSQMVMDAYKGFFPHTVSGKSRINQGDQFAREHGRAAGQRADIGGNPLGGQGKKAINR